MKGLRILAVLTFMMAFTVVALPEKSSAGSQDDQTRASLVLEQARQTYNARERWEALRTNNTLPGNISSSPAQWLKRVSPSEVNMVTNRHEEKAQNEVTIDGKVYRVADEACAENMEKNPSTRFSKDPLTGNTVDKSISAVYADASGAVYYFESDSTFGSFMALAEKETVFGYTSPK